LPPDERRAFIYPLLFGSIDAPAKIDDLRSIVATWAPDLVVHDSCDLAAPIAAAERDLPSVHHSFGRMVPPAIVAGAVPVTEPLWRATGLTPEPYAGMFRGIYVDIAPPSFQTETFPAGVRVEPLRSASLDAPSTERAPGFLEHLPERPTVYVTLGTVHNDPSVFRLLLDAFADIDCNVIATIGRNNDPAELAPFPANAHVVRYISQALVLPHASVVVSHGGSGSTLAALAHGLPMLFVPRGADQFENAAHVQALGAGLRLVPDELTVPAARSALESLLADTSYRERAQKVAGEIAAMPEPSSLVPLLVELA
jgi:UDP:flavonoid glycosyltransferase YjiC (YdhE family)